MEDKKKKRRALLGDKEIKLIGNRPKEMQQIKGKFAIPAARNTKKSLRLKGLSNGTLILSTLPNIGKHACVRQILDVEEKSEKILGKKIPIYHVSSDEPEKWGEVTEIHPNVKAKGYSIYKMNNEEKKEFLNNFGVEVENNQRIAHGLFGIKNGKIMTSLIPTIQMGNPDVNRFLKKFQSKIEQRNHADIIIVGAGAAGIGMGVLLQKIGIDFIILEKKSIGESFKKWPKEMQFISPSFTGNFFGMPDLNAITPETSPAYNFLTEHPSGKQYAKYLKGVANYYELPIFTGVEVKSITKKKENFLIKTKDNELHSKFVIWAGGEYQYPNDNPFPGAQYCIHNSKINNWSKFYNGEYLVIGAYESGIDAAYQLAKKGMKVVVLDSGNEMTNVQSDSSYSLSPFTRERYLEQKASIKIVPNAKVKEIQQKNGKFIAVTEDGRTFKTKTKPILATGFKSSLSLIGELFSREQGVVQLTENDESKKTKGLFLAGPQVRHKDAIFCFIYKFRQRFAVIAENIAKRLGKTNNAKKIIEEYKNQNFYLKDLSCCGDDCPC